MFPQFPIYFSNYSKKSFTLIELLVVVSIILIFSGLSLASYHQFNETKKLEAETKKLVEILELAKKKINSGDKEKLGNNYSGCDLTAYKVTINDTNSYSLKATVCATQGTNCSLPNNQCQDVNIFTYTLPQGIILSPNSLSVVFYPFGKSSFAPPPPPPATFGCIKITNNALGKSQYIKVDSSGTITIVPSC